MAELNWHFSIVEGLALGDGSNNTLDDLFKGQTDEETLVRESLQNSLDANRRIIDPTNHAPVKVSFSFEEINLTKDLPNFGKVKDHIRACAEYRKEDDKGRVKFEPLAEFAESHQDKITCLKVSDSNTIGMNYYPNKRSGRFHSFLLEKGSTDKQEGGGGSFGYGKWGYFLSSKMRTIIVSSKSDDTGHVFAGATILASHVINVNGQEIEYHPSGYYSTSKNAIVTDKDDIPEKFKRKESGTTIAIMGVDETKEGQKEICYKLSHYVLLHFWAAIDAGRLVVKIEDEEINKENIEELMHRHFEHEMDTSKDDYSNPLPYFLATKAIERGVDNCRVYGGDDEELGLPKHKELGKCKLYILKNDSMPKVLYMRRPLMVIGSEYKGGSNHYSAVFVCEDPEGDENLKVCEPPTHNMWDKKRAIKKENSKKAYNQFVRYVNACIKHFFKSTNAESGNFFGLDEAFHATKDVSNPVGSDSNVDSQNGNPDEEHTNNVTASFTTKVTFNTDKEKAVKKTGSFATVSKVKSGGKTKTSLATIKKEKKNKKEKKKNKTLKKTELREGGDKEIAAVKIFPVELRRTIDYVESDTGDVVHVLKFNSSHATDKGIIDISVNGADQLYDYPIRWANKGKWKGNRISQIPITEGSNEIHFKLIDNHTRSISIASYEE